MRKLERLLTVACPPDPAFIQRIFLDAAHKARQVAGVVVTNDLKLGLNGVWEMLNNLKL